MKSSVLRFSSLAAASVILLAAIAAPVQRAAAQPGSPCGPGGTAPIISAPTVPALPKLNSDINFDCTIWQAFISLNWPALPGKIGIPDTSKPLGAPGPTVWQTFESADQVFPPSGGPPSALRPARAAQRSDPGQEAAIQSGVRRILTQKSKISPALLNRSNPNKDMVDMLFANVLGTGETLRDIDQAGGGVLIDQNGQYVYYEELLDPTEAAYIETNQLYNAAQQNSYAQQKGLDLPPGSIELKAAWKVMGANDDASHFITSQALLDGGMAPVTVGLVGLHVMLRATGLPQGIWATFAQSENAPLINGTAGHYSFNNPACAPGQCPVNTLTVPPAPTQVQQIFPVDSASAQVNAYVAALLKSSPANLPFSYYQLLNVQWPQSPSNLPPPPQSVPLPSGTPNTKSMMNPVLETYLQQPNVSCLSAQCHSSAVTARSSFTSSGPYAASYSFLFSHAQ